jgi:predicted Zn-dependent protease
LDGLLDQAHHPDEIAGILAHEIAHIHHRHVSKAAVENLSLAALVSLALGDVGGIVAGGVIVLGQSSYSREKEREADQTALEILAQTGVSNKPLRDFHHRLHEAHAEGSFLPRILSTHPESDERMAMIDTVATYNTSRSLSPQQWHALKHICDA